MANRASDIIAEFTRLGIRPTPLAVIAACTDAGLTSDAAVLVTDTVQRRLNARAIK